MGCGCVGYNYRDTFELVLVRNLALKSILFCKYVGLAHIRIVRKSHTEVQNVIMCAIGAQGKNISDFGGSCQNAKKTTCN